MNHPVHKSNHESKDVAKSHQHSVLKYPCLVQKNKLRQTSNLEDEENVVCFETVRNEWLFLNYKHIF